MPRLKEELFAQIAQGSLSKTEAARRLQISRRTLDRWLQKHLVQAPQVQAPQVLESLQEEVQALTEEVLESLQEEVQALTEEVLELRDKLRELAEKEAPTKQERVTLVKRVVVLEPDVAQHSFSSFAGVYLRSVSVWLKAKPHGRGTRVLLQWDAFLGSLSRDFEGGHEISVQGGVSIGDTIYLVVGVKDPVYSSTETYGDVLQVFPASQRKEALEALKQARAKKQEVTIIPVVVA
jgi:hypothetical protein